MKKVLYVAIVTIVLFACNNSTPHKVVANDTTQVLALYISARTAQVEYGLIKRVVLDTFIYVDVDTLTKQKKWTRDSVYLITYMLPIDSATSKKYGNMKITDSSGKKILYPYTVPTNKKFVASGWERADTLSVNNLLKNKP